MTELLLDVLRGLARLKHERGGRVSQAVRGEVLGLLAAFTPLRKTFRTLCASSVSPERVRNSQGGRVVKF